MLLRTLLRRYIFRNSAERAVIRAIRHNQPWRLRWLLWLHSERLCQKHEQELFVMALRCITRNHPLCLKVVLQKMQRRYGVGSLYAYALTKWPQVKLETLAEIRARRQELAADAPAQAT
ncbi:MAG: hypothetical protein EBQ80_04990 [Proteobacteria bacterium]|nr:hypothetical protein [Pseudomonadota bacterium]